MSFSATETHVAHAGAAAGQVATAQQSLHDIKFLLIQVRNVVAGALGVAFSPIE